jgi:hypothetical protein
MFWHFWGFGNCFGYFIQKLGEFSPNLLVALVLTHGKETVFLIKFGGFLTIKTRF